MLYIYHACGCLGFRGFVASPEPLSDRYDEPVSKIGESRYMGTGISATLTEILAVEVPEGADKAQMLDCVRAVKPELVDALDRGFTNQ